MQVVVLLFQLFHVTYNHSCRSIHQFDIFFYISSDKSHYYFNNYYYYHYYLAVLCACPDEGDHWSGWWSYGGVSGIL